MTNVHESRDQGCDTNPITDWEPPNTAAALATVREGLVWGLGLRHQTRRETRVGENNYWDVNVHEPEGCKRCEVDAALFAAAFVRMPGGRYVVAMTPEMWAAMWREAQ